MAVETRHLCLFPPQILSSRVTVDGMEGNGNSMYGGGGPMGYGPLSGTTTMTDTSLIPPMYATTVADSIPVKTPMKSDSGLTYSIPVSRKRSRDNNAGGILPDHRLLAFPQNHQQNSGSNRGGSFTFLGQDISWQIQQQQFEIYRFISQHMAKVKMEMEERRKNYSRKIITAMEETVMKKLRAKDEEIDKVQRLNWALEEKVKSLCVENQIWRELAQTNEATANALRTNLEQLLLAQQLPPDNDLQADAALLDDAESCCGSNLISEEEDRGQNEYDYGGASSGPLLDDIEMNEGKKRKSGSYRGDGSLRLCRNCGKDEASVLLLPCRHLCLCGVCGPSLHTCPICLSTKNGTLRVNLSTSY